MLPCFPNGHRLESTDEALVPTRTHPYLWKSLTFSQSQFIATVELFCQHLSIMCIPLSHPDALLPWIRTLVKLERALTYENITKLLRCCLKMHKYDNLVYLHQTLILFFSWRSLAHLQVKIFDYFFLLVWKIEREACFLHCQVSELLLMSVIEINLPTIFMNIYTHVAARKSQGCDFLDQGQMN